MTNRTQQRESEMASVTKREAEKFLRALKKQRAAWIDDDSKGPELLEDWDWTGYGGFRWSIVWEEGPYDWSDLFPFGGVDEEFGGRIADVSEGLPETLYAESITGWAVGIAAI